VPRDDSSIHDGRSRADPVREKFGWSWEIFWALLDFPSLILAGNRDSRLRAEQSMALKRIKSGLRKVEGALLYPPPLPGPIRAEMERGKERIYFPAVFERSRDLREEVAACLAYIVERRSCTLAALPQGLKPLQWIIWNLAPFFRHTSETATRHVQDIAWRDMVVFLDAAPSSARLNRKRKPSKDRDGNSLAEMEAERFRKLYERLKDRTPNLTYDPILFKLLARHKGRSPMEALHHLVATHYDLPPLF